MTGMKSRTYAHPKPFIDRVSQVVALIGAALLAISAPLFVLLPLTGAPGGFALIAVVVLLLALPLVMLTVTAPAVTVSDSGLTLHPVVWRDQAISWDSIQSVQVYPLLPSADSEVTRRVAVGKRHYRPADGIMLVIPGLPWQYRIAGAFAGVGMKPVIALTNRAHSDYDRLVRIVLNSTDPACHADELLSRRPGE